MIQNRFYFNFDIKTALILSLVVHSIIVFTEYIKVNKNPLDNLQIIVDLVPIPEPKKKNPRSKNQNQLNLLNRLNHLRFSKNQNQLNLPNRLNHLR